MENTDKHNDASLFDSVDDGALELLSACNPKRLAYSIHNPNINYTTRANAILNRFRKEAGSNTEAWSYDELMAFGHWLVSFLRHTLSPDSWRAYRDRKSVV